MVYLKRCLYSKININDKCILTHIYIYIQIILSICTHIHTHIIIHIHMYIRKCTQSYTHPYNSYPHASILIKSGLFFPAKVPTLSLSSNHLVQPSSMFQNIENCMWSFRSKHFAKNCRQLLSKVDLDT